MKKINLLLICFFLLSGGLKAQTETPTNKWFVTFSTGFCIGAPGVSIDDAMTNQSFDLPSQGWFGNTTYPVTSTKPTALVMLGKRITKYGSLYLVVGQPTGGQVAGYNGVSVVSFDYHVLQFTLGYQFSFPNTRFKLGVGPSLFTFKNIPEADYKHVSEESSSVAGATLTLRMPFGKEKKLCGIEFFGLLNLAPSVKWGEIKNLGRTFQAGSVSMSYAIIGISFALRG
jgi:hypothetical protein